MCDPSVDCWPVSHSCAPSFLSPFQPKPKWAICSFWATPWLTGNMVKVCFSPKKTKKSHRIADKIRWQESKWNRCSGLINTYHERVRKAKKVPRRPRESATVKPSLIRIIRFSRQNFSMRAAGSEIHERIRGKSSSQKFHLRSHFGRGLRLVSGACAFYNSRGI